MVAKMLLQSMYIDGDNSMATITIKNIPDSLYGQLKHVAQMNCRSINSEVIICIERRLASHKRDVPNILERARQLRALTADSPISNQDLQDAIDYGRS